MKAKQSLVLYAKNKARVSSYYQRTLGLAVEESAAAHDVLCGPGVELVIHAVPRQYRAGIHITKPPEVREETPMKPVFVVNDLAIVRREAHAAGGGLKPDEAAWSWRGYVVLDGFDCEGNVVQFKQKQSKRQGTGR